MYVSSDIQNAVVFAKLFRHLSSTLACCQLGSQMNGRSHPTMYWSGSVYIETNIWYSAEIYTHSHIRASIHKLIQTTLFFCFIQMSIWTLNKVLKIKCTDFSLRFFPVSTTQNNNSEPFQLCFLSMIQQFNKRELNLAVYFIWFDLSRFVLILSVFLAARICSGKMCKIIKWLIHWATSFRFVYFAFFRSFVHSLLFDKQKI